MIRLELIIPIFLQGLLELIFRLRARPDFSGAVNKANAVFTLGRNMFSLITNQKHVSLLNVFKSGAHYANRDGNMFTLSMMKLFHEVLSVQNQTK